jgi:hypothetical protein
MRHAFLIFKTCALEGEESGGEGGPSLGGGVRLPYRPENYQLMCNLKRPIWYIDLILGNQTNIKPKNNAFG